MFSLRNPLDRNTRASAILHSPSPQNIISMVTSNIVFLLIIFSSTTFSSWSYVGRARNFGSIPNANQIKSLISNCSALYNFEEAKLYTNHVSSNSPTENELMLLLFIVAVMLLMFVYTCELLPSI